MAKGLVKCFPHNKRQLKRIVKCPNIFMSLWRVVLFIVSFGSIKCSVGCGVNNIVFLKGFKIVIL